MSAITSLSILKITSILVALFAILFPLLLSYAFKGRIAQYLSPPYSFQDIPDLSGRLAVVTGANTGIGKVTVRELARKNAHVIATTRDKVKGEAAIAEIRKELGDSVKISLVLLDLASFSSVEKAVKDIKSVISKHSLKLDILILNVSH